MTTYLLDANVLIALTVAEHEHHVRATTWVATVDRFAVCPVSEGALIRFLVRLGESPAAAQAVVSAVHEVSGCEFWADSISYAGVGLGHVRGHRQVTDAYLVSLASAHERAVLATLDHGLAQEFPGDTLVIPQL